MKFVWILWANDIAPVRYEFQTDAEINAFLQGMEAVNRNLLSDGGQWEQFDSLEEFNEKYPAKK